MSNRIKISVNARVELPSGEHRYIGAVGDNLMRFVDVVDGKDLFLSQDTFVALYAKRQVRVGGTKVGDPHDDNSFMLAPDDVLSPIEKARRWYTTQFDRAPSKLSDKALRGFILVYQNDAVSAGVAFVPSTGSVRRWVNDRGEAGRRPTGAVRTKTGKVPRRGRFPAFVERALERVVAWYWAEEGRDKTGAHARLAGLIATANCLGKERYKGTWSELPLPSYETVRARIDRAANRATWTAKYGSRRAKLAFGGTAPTLEASRILETVVIDATVVDGWCVWSEDSMLPLGRPTLYIAIDVRSRMIIAWLLTFEPPSLYGVMALLERIVTPNEEGVWGKPDEIVVDCGWEFVSPSFQETCESAGISVHWAPIDFGVQGDRRAGVQNDQPSCLQEAARRQCTISAASDVSVWDRPEQNREHYDEAARRVAQLHAASSLRLPEASGYRRGAAARLGKGNSEATPNRR